MSTGSRWGRTVENICILLTLVLLWYVFMASGLSRSEEALRNNLGPLDVCG
jgi:hypothetical protein